MAGLAIALAIGGAFLSASLQVLVDKLDSSELQEVGSHLGIHGNLKKLSNTVARIQSIMAEVDERRLLKDPSLSMWLRELKDVAYDAEDALATFTNELLWKRMESDHKSFVDIKFLFTEGVGKKINKMVDKILSELKGITREWDELRLGWLPNGNCNSFQIADSFSGEWETSSLPGNLTVFGRVLEKEKIIKLLLGGHNKSSSLSNVSVLPIVGMGGLGKTSLAQLVFHDPRIKEHFDAKMWVWVSEEFDIRRLTRRMLESVGEECPDTWSLEATQTKLADRLRGKKFLLVLDDIWNEDNSQWCRLQSPLIGGDNDSMVLVTTRNEGVADAMQSMEPLYLEELPFKDCWNIFTRRVFADGHLSMPPKLEVIGREIVKKAGGVPLGVKKLSDLLYRKAEERRWRDILEADTWGSIQGDHDILSSLRRSYHHLPTHLKRCFAYFSLFPKKYVFDKWNVIHMWVAQGFIRTTLEGQSMEELGSDYFDELVRRSLITPSTIGNAMHDSLLEPSAIGYVMHDLLIDLAKTISADECICVDKGHTHNLNAKYQSIRHISINSHFRFDTLYGFQKVRTLLNLTWHNQKQYTNLANWPSLRNDLDELFNKLKLLRILDLSYCPILHVPDSVGSLKHLHYLDLSNTFLKKLPSSTCKLYNLQTLRLKDCILLQDLPKDICNLLNLRHLVADVKLVVNIINIGKLTSLQELEVFRVSREKGRKIEELIHMNELHGILSIQNLQIIRGEKGVKPGILKNKLHLQSLELEWDHCKSAADRRNSKADKNILQNLQPPLNLEDLTIKFYGGLEFPNWMNVRSVKNLESVSLCNCKNAKFLPCLGELPFLKYLEGMDSIENIGGEFTGSTEVGFPQLEKLEFYDLPAWVEWSIATGGCCFPCLQELIINGCPKLQSRNLPLSEQRKSLIIDSSPGILNGSLFTMLQKQDALFFSMKKDYPSLTSCVIEALQYLTSLKVLKVRFCEEDMASSASTKAPISLEYRLSPIFSSEAELEILGKVNRSDRDNSISILHTCIVDRLKHLSSFFVQDCPDFSSLHLEDVLPNLRFLEEIEISRSKQMGGLQWLHEGLESLKVLRFENCPDLVCLPREALRHHTSLECLSIISCEELISLEFQTLPFLKSMWIGMCPKLIDTVASSISQSQYIDGPLPLESLTMDRILLLSTRLVHKFNALQKIIIRQCYYLFSFSDEEEEGLQSISSLQHLEFIECPNLHRLPAEFHKLQSLRSLLIFNCPSLQSLPEKGLPPSLERVEITECQNLINRCQRGGLDWTLLAQIPAVILNTEETTNRDTPDILGP